jgi:hypothetical protein
MMEEQTDKPFILDILKPKFLEIKFSASKNPKRILRNSIVLKIYRLILILLKLLM